MFEVLLDDYRVVPPKDSHPFSALDENLVRGRRDITMFCIKISNIGITSLSQIDRTHVFLKQGHQILQH